MVSRRATTVIMTAVDFQPETRGAATLPDANKRPVRQIHQFFVMYRRNRKSNGHNVEEHFNQVVKLFEAGKGLTSSQTPSRCRHLK
jgi:hypothetical protein